MLGKRQRKVLKYLSGWAKTIVDETSLGSHDAVFTGYHAGTLPSLVLSTTAFDDDFDPALLGPGFSLLKGALARLARPLAVIQSDELRNAAPEYFAQHADFTAAVLSLPGVARGEEEQEGEEDRGDGSGGEGDAGAEPVKAAGQDLGFMSVMLTHSTTAHFDLERARGGRAKRALGAALGRARTMHLAEMSSERRARQLLLPRPILPSLAGACLGFKKRSQKTGVNLAFVSKV